MRKIIFTQTETKEIISQYLNGKSLREIGDNFLVSKGVIKRILIENNIKMRQRTPKYQAQYDIFEIIDNPEKAYWLGFIAADGCNYQREHNASIVLNIHQKDIDHLQKFKEFCKTNAIIKTYTTSAGFSNNTPMCKLVLNSKKMSQDLANKGVVPRKSLILGPPKIDSQFYLPFILGYFDGDGSIGQANNSNFFISIQGTQELLTWINEILDLSTTLETRNDDGKNSYYIRCGGIQKPYHILSQLYNSCEVHLERKYLIYQNLKTVVLNRNIK